MLLFLFYFISAKRKKKKKKILIALLFNLISLFHLYILLQGYLKKPILKKFLRWSKES